MPLLCLVVMVATDYLLGSKAEYLNAYDTIKRSLGLNSTIKPSWIIQKSGLFGAWLTMGLSSLLLGISLTVLLRWLLPMLNHM